MIKLLEHQEIPTGDWWDVWYLNGERISGKTIAAVNFANEYLSRGSNVLWLSDYSMDDYVVSKFREIGERGFKYRRRFLTPPHTEGSVRFISPNHLSVLDAVRGQVYAAVVWEDVESAKSYIVSQLIDYVQFGMRSNEKLRILFTGTGLPPQWLADKLSTKNVTYKHGVIASNYPNLSSAYSTTF